MSLRSWSPLKVVYTVAHYSWNMKGFVFKATYTFNNDAVCGQRTITQTAGKFRMNRIHEECCPLFMMPHSLLGIYYNFSKTLVNFYQTTWYYIAGDSSSYLPLSTPQNLSSALFYSFCYQIQHELITFTFISRTDVHENKL